MSADVNTQSLARRHRPASFAGLIGQDALVTTLTNAFRKGRTAQAYLLTGVRGTGKTTTARVLARAFNCEQGPTAEPCGSCAQCRAVAENRHMDVLEMDAASRTSVEGIRELTDGIVYAPVMGRRRVYIIDEVHMLSKAAFNALLKTLEEPPAHAVFVFATTEARKIPATVLSRCQRFDLKRVDVETLAAHYDRVCAREGAEADPAALRLIAEAADGSVRDGLSVLEQALSGASGRLEAEQVRAMLGLVERVRAIESLHAALEGRPADALAGLRAMADQGADPQMVLKDMLAHAHWIAVAASAPDAAGDLPGSDDHAGAAQGIAARLGVRRAQEVWSRLLRAVDEAQGPAPAQAAEIALLAVAAAADEAVA